VTEHTSPLRCSSLEKSFDGVKALRVRDLEFPVSGITAIVGPNGAGKTTLLNALTGFVRPDAGTVFLGNREITHLPPWRIARLGVARSFQEMRLVRLVTALENVMLARPNQRGERLFAALTGIGVAAEEATNRAKATELLRFVGLLDKTSDLAGQLSYGQQKLLSLACCLAGEPRVLLLDEPVAGVHAEVAQEILNLLVRLAAQGRLVVFVEHDFSAVRRVADMVVVMDQGSVIAAGRPEDVLSRPEVVEAFVA